VLGRTVATFRSEADRIVRQHFADLDAANVTEQLSRNSAYLSLTFMIYAPSREDVDALYRELTASDEIMMVL
jgi:putative lipoic acid-binding regulatory protein